MTIPSGYAQANLIFTGEGVPTGSQITIGLDLGSFSGSPADAADVIGDSFGTEVMLYLTDSVTLSEVLVKFGPDATGPSGSAYPNVTGDSSATAVTPQVALLVQKVTALGGKAGRGRMYIPGIAENVVGRNGLIDPAAVTSYQTGLDAFYADLTVGDMTPVVLHGAGSPLTTPTPITSFVVDARVATQRQRNRR